MSYGFLFLVTALVWGLGLSTFAPHAEGQSPVSKSEGLPSPPAPGVGDSIRVLWRVADYKVGKSAVRGKEEAQKLLFKPLDIGSTYITFDGKTCRDIVFNKTNVKAGKYLDQAYCTSPQALGIGEDALEVVKTNCDLPGFAEYMRLKDSRLVIHIDGVFFYFEPAVNY
jgi:hypothetical protein